MDAAGTNEKTNEVYVYEQFNLFPVEFKHSFSAILGEEDEAAERARFAEAQPSQYHLDDLRVYPATANERDHNLFDRPIPPTRVENAVHSEIVTKTQLLNRVQRLESGFYRVHVADGQLHFVQSSEMDTSTARSIGSKSSVVYDLQTARSLTDTADCKTAKEREVTVDEVEQFFSQPGASEALAAYKLELEVHKNRPVAKSSELVTARELESEAASEAELRQNLVDLEHLDQLSPRLAGSETERPTTHDLQHTPVDYDQRASQSAEQLGSSLAHRLLTEDPNIITARSIDFNELTDQTSSKDVETARLPEDEELLDLMLRTARAVESDVCTGVLIEDDPDVRTAVEVGSGTEL